MLFRVLFLCCCFSYCAFGQQVTATFNEVNLLQTKVWPTRLPVYTNNSKDGKALVVYFDEIEIPKKGIKLDLTRYENKDVYIICNRIVFNGLLDIQCSGVNEGIYTNNENLRGGEVVIYAHEAEFNIADALWIKSGAAETVGAFKREDILPVVKGKPDDVGAIKPKLLLPSPKNQIDRAIEAIKRGGVPAVERSAGGGNAMLIFDRVKLNEQAILQPLILEMTSLLDKTNGGNEDDAILIQDLLDMFRPDALKDFPEYAGSTLEQSYQAISAKRSGWPLEINFNNTSDLTKEVRNDFTRLILAYISFYVDLSRNFSDLNLGEACGAMKMDKLLTDNLPTFRFGKSDRILAKNAFVAFKSSSRGPHGKLIFYEDLNNFFDQQPAKFPVIERWTVLMLKNIKMALMLSIKNSDDRQLLNTIRRYNMIPPIPISDEKLQNEYTQLLEDINKIRDNNRLKVTPVDDNRGIQEINDQTIKCYSLPAKSVVTSYSIDNVDKLGVVNFDNSLKEMTLDFKVQLTSDPELEERLKKISSKSGSVYSGVYKNWNIEDYEISIPSYNKNDSYIRKDGMDVLTVHLKFHDDRSKLPLAMLFNNLFSVRLKARSAQDPNFQFQCDIPLSFRYSNYRKVQLEGNQIKNITKNALKISGYSDGTNDVVLDQAITVLPNSSATISGGNRISSVPNNMIEEILPTDFTSNYSLFEDLTGYKSLQREFTIYNNCRPVNERKNIFESLTVTIKYYLNGNLRVITKTIKSIGQTEIFPLPYSNQKEDFEISAVIQYENERIVINPVHVSGFSVNIDANFGK